MSRFALKKRIEQGEFLEMNYFSGNYYGTSLQQIAEINKQKKIALVEIDINGLEKVYSKGIDYTSFAILPHTETEKAVSILRERLEKRCIFKQKH